jgi:hypothetical protein
MWHAKMTAECGWPAHEESFQKRSKAWEYGDLARFPYDAQLR